MDGSRVGILLVKADTEARLEDVLTIHWTKLVLDEGKGGEFGEEVGGVKMSDVVQDH